MYVVLADEIRNLSDKPFGLLRKKAHAFFRDAVSSSLSLIISL